MEILIKHLVTQVNEKNARKFVNETQILKQRQ